MASSSSSSVPARSVVTSLANAPIYSSIHEALSPGVEAGSRGPGMGSKHKLLVSLVAASAVVGIILLFVFYIYCYRKLKGRVLKKNDHSCLDSASCKKTPVSIMEYKTLELATDCFGDGNLLGAGGFGCVYKAKLEGDCFVAVKRLTTTMGTADAVREFQTEVDLLSKIQHPNIIALLGYSIHAESRLLVYELMQNGSLETQLHGPSRGSALTWHIRMKIALDVARGLEYLHEHCHPPVIHRDLKSSNILLDSNFNAKLSDFGLAVLDGPQNKNNIKLSGTLGYVAPEYLLDGKLTDKSDVYAFGVVLLELLLGRKPMEKLSPEAQCQSIVTWAMPQLTDRAKLPNIVDPVVGNSMDLKHLYQVAAVAVLCVQPEPSYRPLITDILHSLVPLVPFELGGTLRNLTAVATTPPS
ncbi:protein kinase superfamily protein [Striga asiatica]|uniref:Protein kinase superfamily protein n=1 Tax=Striga asiatica TaxID=4170 RepID=A0A5A7P5B4_STRAF|nr:protein kinase superfamily protein [Striga asiatica]